MEVPTVSSLFEIADAHLIGRIKNCKPFFCYPKHSQILAGSFVDQLSAAGRENDDLVYTVSALASVISHSEQELLYFVTEIIDICFLNEHSRENFYKVI